MANNTLDGGFTHLTIGDNIWMGRPHPVTMYIDDFAVSTTRIGSALKGDVQCDKAVDILDVQALVNCILGTGACDWGCGNSANVNNDEFIDILDVQCVVNIILCGICEGGC